MNGDYIALEIRTPELADIASYIDPELQVMDFETELKHNFLVLGFPAAGKTQLITPGIFNKYFDHIENGSTVTFKRFVKKPKVEEDPLRKTPFIQN